MEQYRFRMTKDMDHVMKEHGMKMLVSSDTDSEAMITFFRVKDGPVIPAFLIVTGESTDFALRMNNFLSEIPDEKYQRMMEACNILNRNTEHITYSISPDYRIQIAYDFPKLTGSAGISRMVITIFDYISEVIDSHYAFLMNAMNTDTPLEDVESMITNKTVHIAGTYRAS